MASISVSASQCASGQPWLQSIADYDRSKLATCLAPSRIGDNAVQLDVRPVQERGLTNLAFSPMAVSQVEVLLSDRRDISVSLLASRSQLPQLAKLCEAHGERVHILPWGRRSAVASGVLHYKQLTDEDFYWPSVQPTQGQKVYVAASQLESNHDSRVLPLSALTDIQSAVNQLAPQDALILPKNAYPDVTENLQLLSLYPQAYVFDGSASEFFLRLGISLPQR